MEKWKTKYHTVGTVSKSNRKAKNTTLSEQFQNLIEKYHTVGTVSKSKSIPLTHKYMTTHFQCLEQKHKKNVGIQLVVWAHIISPLNEMFLYWTLLVLYVHEFTHGEFRVVLSSVFCVVCCLSLFLSLSFSFWSLINRSLSFE
jgi:hypothetical protein